MKVLFVMINISDNKWIIRFYFLFMVDDTRSTSRFVSHKICFETVINRFLIIFCISIFLLRRTFILDTRFTKWVLMCWSVCWTVPVHLWISQETAHWYFLKFCMKLGVNQVQKVTWQELKKNYQMFQNFSRIVKVNRLYHLTMVPLLGKILIWD